MSFKVCVTGGIACGKSLVGGFIAELGIPVRDADDVCRELMMTGSSLYDAVIAGFGEGVVGPDGELDRRALGEIVRVDKEKREKLNALVHPLVRKTLDDWMMRHAEEKGCVAAIIPLLFEVGWEKGWDIVICVAAPKPMQIERLKQRGLSEKEALEWIATQMSVEEKMRRSDYVVFNSGAIECAKNQVVTIFKNMT